MSKISNIGVFTSGGDAPGMNAAVRAVVRSGIYHDLNVFGIHRGYEGMIMGEIRQLMPQHVSSIIQRGGTILKSARSKKFMTQEGMKRAYDELKKLDIDAVVAIGGDGTFRGALDFTQTFDMPFIGLPGTIDNDMFGTDYTIGFDTALNTVVEAVDKLRDTAHSHDRLFFIEVMGRDAGFIALHAGLACGAEAILIPEVHTDITHMKDFLENGAKRKKTSNIILVAEGDEEGGALDVARKVKEDFSEYDVRVTILGHIQRGGSPTAFDRVLASRLGAAAVDALLEGKRNIMIGMVNKQTVQIPFEKTVKNHHLVNKDLLKLVEILSL